MTKAFKVWAFIFFVAALAALLSPFLAACFGDGLNSEAMAFAEGGPLGLGYDYIGRPVAPQLLSGGQDLLLASLLTALISRALGFGMGVRIACQDGRSKALRFLLDVCLVLPLAVVSLVSYQAFNGSVYAVIPAVCVLTLPFSSRYYEKLIHPVLQSSYFHYARLRERSIARLILREGLPVLSKNILTDVSQAFISAIYMLSTVTFLGSTANRGKFVWPQMVAANLSGFALNPWACLAPLMAILFLTVPLGNCVDALERKGR